MRIAISTDGDFVSAHFGRCPFFTIVDIEGEKIVKKEKIANPGHMPGAIPQFLHQKNVECIIAGGMGMRATGFFEEFGIKAIVGISGKVDDVIEQIQKGLYREGRVSVSRGRVKGMG